MIFIVVFKPVLFFHNLQNLLDSGLLPPAEFLDYRKSCTICWTEQKTFEACIKMLWRWHLLHAFKRCLSKLYAKSLEFWQFIEIVWASPKPYTVSFFCWWFWETFVQYKGQLPKGHTNGRWNKLLIFFISEILLNLLSSSVVFHCFTSFIIKK